MALDYEVAPAPHVDRLTLAYDFEPRIQPADVERAVDCPLTLAVSDYVPTEVADDVVRVRVGVKDDAGEGRSADLFVPVGSRTLEVPLSGLDLTSADPDLRWFAVFEPAWGEHRIALFPVPISADDSLSLAGLPAGPGRIALVQTAAVVEQEGTTLLHAPEGFAGDFAAYATGWHQFMVSTPEGEPAEPLEVVPPGSTPRFQPFGAALTWSPSDAPLVVSVPAGEQVGAVRVPCDTDLAIFVTGFAQVTVAVDEAEPDNLGPGERAHPKTECESGSDSVVWSLASTSLNGRGYDLVFREVAQ